MLRFRVIPLVFLIACGNAGPSSPPPAQPAAVPTTPAPALLTAADAGTAQTSEARVDVVEATGVSAAQITPLIQPAKEPLGRCHTGGGGKINVRVTRKDNATILSIAPGTSLDPRAQHCVLEALSTLGLEETGGNVGGPTPKPSGFTSLITVSW